MSILLVVGAARRSRRSIVAVLCLLLLVGRRCEAFGHSIHHHHVVVTNTQPRSPHQRMIARIRIHPPRPPRLVDTPRGLGGHHLLLPPSTPWIAAHDAWGNIAILTGAAWSAQILGNCTAIGRLLGPPVTAMTLTFAFASIGLIAPGGTVAATQLQTLSLQLATPLVLLGADLRDAVDQCGPLLLSFALASVATLVGCIIGYRYTMAGAALRQALGEHDGLVIAAALLAKNIGGGINYVAVCQSCAASPMAVAAGLCVDNLFALIYFPITSYLANGRPDVVDTSNITVAKEDDTRDGPHSNDITVQSISNVLFTAAVLLWTGQKLGGSAGAALPVCSLLTVLYAALAPHHNNNANRRTATLLGNVALYLFFATAGAPGLAVADSVRSSLVPLSVYLFCLYSIHGGILWLAHWLFGRSRRQNNSSHQSWAAPPRLLVASSAAIGGPATAVALTQAAGWTSLQVPAVLVGNIGYAIATFVGLLFVRFFSP
jgi:uncharacterized membrane protein